MTFVAVTLSPGGIIAWLVVGLIAGAIAGRLTRGAGYGCVMDIIVGLVGAFVGGLILSPFVNSNKPAGFFETTAIAIVGAVVLLFVVRLVRRD